jgi:hypothetical protein
LDDQEIEVDNTTGVSQVVPVSRAGDSTNQIGNHVGSVAKMSMDSKVGNKGSLATEKVAHSEEKSSWKWWKKCWRLSTEGSHYGGRGE